MDEIQKQADVDTQAPWGEEGNEHSDAGGQTPSGDNHQASSRAEAQAPPTANLQAPSNDDAQKLSDHELNRHLTADSPKPSADKVMPHEIEGILDRYFRGPFIRCAFIGLLTLMLLIPLGYVERVISERNDLYLAAVDDITSSWGGAQTICGPVLVIPYTVWEDHKETVGKGKDLREVVKREYFKRYKVVLPVDLEFAAQIDSQVRYRGIYRQILYDAPVTIGGRFTLPQANEFAPNLHQVHWGAAWMAVGISDLKGIHQETPLQWNGAAAPEYEPGAKTGDILGSGIRAAISLPEDAAGTKQTFSLQLKIRGSNGLYFTPVGKRTTIAITGAWPHPSFRGNLLPAERNVSEHGFSAKWNISNLTRTYPQMDDLDNDSPLAGIKEFSAGVDLYETVTLYRMISRAVHYGILFIAVSFVALFVFEMLSRRRLHLLQYGMVGISMSLFYLILLSLAEHVSFAASFTAASVVTIGMNSLYIAAALHSKKQGLAMATLLAALYALLFSLLRMEDFSLLVGTGLVVATMGVLMFVTRNLPQGEVPGASGLLLAQDR